MARLRQIACDCREGTGTKSGTPTAQVKVIDCGEMKEEEDDVSTQQSGA
jgi:hypothetical protein